MSYTHYHAKSENNVFFTSAYVTNSFPFMAVQKNIKIG